MTALLEEVLPLDDERMVEARVWSAFSARAMCDPAMAAIRREADQGVRHLCEACLRALSQVGGVHLSRDTEVETERLWSLLDGMTMHILLADPSRSPMKLAGRVLRSHLRDLGTAPASSPGHPMPPAAPGG